MRESASIVIIGAGIIGSSIAYSLAKRNEKDIVVLDKGKAGSGSTSAALGGFRYQFSNELSVRMSIESISAIEKFQEEMGYDPLVRHDGYVFFASNENSYSKLKENCRMANSLGVPVEVLSNEELQSRFPFYSFEGMLGGTLCMKEGHASTSAVLQGYVSKSKQLGVEFFENTEVTKISKDGGFRISTRSGEISSKRVIIAAGAYSGLVGELSSVKIPIKPYPRKILVTHSFSDGIPWNIPLMIDVDSTLAIGREGRGMIMADNSPIPSGFDLSFPEDYDERVISRVVARVPALAKAQISYANAGLYEMTPDSNPIMCEMPGEEGLYCCSGFAGHGFMHSPAVGELMAELVSGEKTHLEISSFDISRFEKETSTEAMVI